MDSEQLAQLIRRSLRRSRRVEVDGLGVFERGNTGRVSLREANRLRVFIAYATEDLATSERLFNVLRSRGYSPWLDRRRLLPGQNWPRRIEDAIANADFFIACFSSHSVKNRGGFQAEVRYAGRVPGSGQDSARNAVR
jgi:transposase